MPLARQCWLCKKPHRYIALKAKVSKAEQKMKFEVAEAATASALGFDPESGSRASNTTCAFCGSAVDSKYVREVGRQRRYGQMLLAVCGTTGRGKRYMSANEVVVPSQADDLVLLESVP